MNRLFIKRLDSGQQTRVKIDPMYLVVGSTMQFFMKFPQRYFVKNFTIIKTTKFK